MVIFKVHPIKKSVHSRNNGESESLSHLVMSDSVTPWAVAHQGPMSMGFSRQEYWSGLTANTVILFLMSEIATS